MKPHVLEKLTLETFEYEMGRVHKLVVDIQRFKFRYKDGYPHSFFYNVQAIMTRFDTLLEAKEYHKAGHGMFYNRSSLAIEFEAAHVDLFKRMVRWLQNTMVLINLICPKYPMCDSLVNPIITHATKLNLPYYITPSIRNRLIMVKLQS